MSRSAVIDADAARGELAEAVQEAAGRTRRWQEVADLLAAALDADAAALLFDVGDDEPPALFASERLAVLAFSSDPPARPLRRPSPGAAVSREPDAFLHAIPHRRLMRERGWSKAAEAGGSAGGIAVWVWVYGSAPDLPAEADRLLPLLLPGLVRAAGTWLRLGRAEEQALLTQAALDRLTVGAVVVDGGCRPRVVNAVARAIAARGDGFDLSTGAVRAAFPADTARLHDCVRAVADHDPRPVHERSRALRLPRLGDPDPYEVLVVPLPRSLPAELAARGAAVLFVADPSAGSERVEHYLRALHGLTEAEARLAAMLLGGRSLVDAAAALGISRNTAHSQLAMVFSKTGTSRQSELVLRLMRAPTGIAPEKSRDAHRPVRGDGD